MKGITRFIMQKRLRHGGGSAFVNSRASFPFGVHSNWASPCTCLQWLATFADPVRARGVIDLVIEGESYRPRLKPSLAKGQAR
jgi:hypothetical protein